MTPSHPDTLGGPIEHARTLLAEVLRDLDEVLGAIGVCGGVVGQEDWLHAQRALQKGREARDKIVLAAGWLVPSGRPSMAMGDDEEMADVFGWPVVVGADAAVDDDDDFGSLPFRGVTPDPVRVGDGDDGRRA